MSKLILKGSNTMLYPKYDVQPGIYLEECSEFFFEIRLAARTEEWISDCREEPMHVPASRYTYRVNSSLSQQQQIIVRFVRLKLPPMIAKCNRVGRLQARPSNSVIRIAKYSIGRLES